MNYLLLLALILAPIFKSSAHTYRPAAKALTDGAYEFTLMGSQFSQSSTFDVDGNELEQFEGNTFSQSDFSITGRYSYGRSLHFVIGAAFRQNSSFNASTEQDLSASGLERLYGGFHYAFDPINRMRYAFEFSYAKTTYTNKFYNIGETLPDEIVLGDDGQYVTGTVHATYSSTTNNHYSASVGLSLPPSHLAMEIPWKLEAAWLFGTWGVLAGVEGITSMGDDEFTEDPAQKPRLPSGVTALYNSINREKMEPFIGLNKSFKSWSMGAKYSQVISGVSTDKGQTIGINLSWSSAGTTTAQKRLNTFKEYDNEASVIKVSPRGTFVRIDKGLTSDVDKGMRFDIFKTDYEGGNVLFATGIVYEVGADWAIVKLTQTYRSEKIQNGYTARGYRQ
tara:strand:- start:31250 stop:32428 length:1179 start_codon:yes stop_codon:yes gene_type:complete